MEESTMRLLLHCLMYVSLVLGFQAMDCSQPCSCYNARFDDLPGLKNAYVMDCSGRGMFYAPHVQKEVTLLNLSNNHFVEFPSFIMATNIQALLLQNNNISSLPKLVHETSKLEYLDMSGNNVNLTEEGFPPGFQNLKIVKIQSPVMHENGLTGLSTLEELHLVAHNGNIPPTLLAKSNIPKTLKKLTIVTNAIPPTLFHPLQQIEEIILYLESPSTMLANNTFNSTELRRLKRLVIFGRELKIDWRQLLMPLLELQTIVLKLNNTETLPHDIFYNEFVGKGCCGNPDDCSKKKNRFYLENITIDGVRELPSFIFDYVKFLDFLKINGTKKPPEGLLYNTTLLRELILTHDNISSITKALLPDSISSVTHLDLSHNHIEVLNNDSFVNIPAVEVLDLSHNQIKSIEVGAFLPIGSTLRYLDLSHNHICHLPADVFKNMTSLEYLRIGFNCLEDLDPHLFEDLGELTHLHLQVNNVTRIPDKLFDGLEKVEYINLQSNHITAVPDIVLDYLFKSNVRSIDLSNNAIVSIPSFNPSKNTSLEDFILGSSANVFCDCGIVPLISMHTGGICEKPLWLKGVEISKLDPKVVCPETKTLESSSTIHLDTTTPDVLTTSVIDAQTSDTYMTIESTSIPQQNPTGSQKNDTRSKMAKTGANVEEQSTEKILVPAADGCSKQTSSDQSRKQDQGYANVTSIDPASSQGKQLPGRGCSLYSSNTKDKEVIQETTAATQYDSTSLKGKPTQEHMPLDKKNETEFVASLTEHQQYSDDMQNKSLFTSERNQRIRGDLHQHFQAAGETSGTNTQQEQNITDHHFLKGATTQLLSNNDDRTIALSDMPLESNLRSKNMDHFKKSSPGSVGTVTPSNSFSLSHSEQNAYSSPVGEMTFEQVEINTTMAAEIQTAKFSAEMTQNPNDWTADVSQPLLASTTETNPTLIDTSHSNINDTSYKPKHPKIPTTTAKDNKKAKPSMPSDHPTNLTIDKVNGTVADVEMKILKSTNIAANNQTSVMTRLHAKDPDRQSTNFPWYIIVAVMAGAVVFAALFYATFKQRGILYERSYTVNRV